MPDTPPATAPAAETPPAPKLPLPVLPPPQTGWLRIVKLDPDVDGGWATGDVDRRRNKIIIDTHNVAEFTIDLSALGVRWDRRVILRINDRSAELRRKETPIAHFRQSPAGAWEVVSD